MIALLSQHIFLLFQIKGTICDDLCQRKNLRDYPLLYQYNIGNRAKEPSITT